MENNSWVFVNKDGTEHIFNEIPFRDKEEGKWKISIYYKGKIKLLENYLDLPKGSIKKLIGRELTWKDDPVNIMNINNLEKIYQVIGLPYYIKAYNKKEAVIKALRNRWGICDSNLVEVDERSIVRTNDFRLI